MKRDEIEVIRLALDEMGLAVTDRPRLTRHVVPRADLVPHEDSPDCICGPSVEVVGSGVVVTHHSLDGREEREPDAA